ncbi:MAG: TrmH family RNA methyltransferase [Acutalibacteraceae bacterium]
MRFLTIDSVNNEKIKHAVKLSTNAKYRRECTAFFLEGLRLCRDAAESAADIFTLFFTEDAYEKYTHDIERIAEKAETAYQISEACANKLSDTKTSQGVFLICGFPPFADESEIDTNGKYIALENIQDPSNLGAICRTAEALGIDGAVLCGCCDVFNPKAQRSAMGSLLRLKIIKTDNLSSLLLKLKDCSMTVLATTPDSRAKSVTEIDMSGGVLAVIGNEGNGVSREIFDLCDLVTIPMKGRAESLNASMAAALVMWEMMR